MQKSRQEFLSQWAHLRGSLHQESSAKLLEDIRSAEEAYGDALESIARMRHEGTDAMTAGKLVQQTQPLREQLLVALDAFRSLEEHRFLQAERSSNARLGRTLTGISVLAVATLALAAVFGFFLLRTLRALRKKEAEANEYVERLERQNGDLDAFAGRIAHDLRSALSPLKLAGERIQRAADDRELVTKLGSQVDRTSKKAFVLLEGLLSFSRSGQPVDSSEVASLPAAVGDVLQETQELAQQVGATVETELQEVGILCSPGLLHLALANLVNNALKFMRERPIRQLRIGCRSHEGRGEVVVEDTGPGIAPEDVSRIFDPFYRAPGVRAAGTGIGLATVRRIIEAHGGTIEVDSALQRGSRFTVRLPQAPPAVPQDEAVSKTRAAGPQKASAPLSHVAQRR
jgi:signal transduction histidine kinase